MMEKLNIAKKESVEEEESRRENMQDAEKEQLSDDSWSSGSGRQKPKKKREFISLRDWTLYQMQDRKRFRNRIRGAGKLGQVFVIDQHLRVQQKRFHFIEKNRTECTTSTKKKVLAAFSRIAEKRNRRIGAVTTVPVRVPGSPRYLRRKFENAVAMANKLGKPDLFLTFTTNTNWKEIQDQLLPEETWCNRQQLVNEVFHKKAQAFLDDVVGKALHNRCRKGLRAPGIFGRVKWFTYSIEFQRSGKPHMHLIVSLENKIKTSLQVDAVCQAVLPKSDTPANARLRELVEHHMVHKPCENDPNADCNEGRKPFWKVCRKHFRKDFSDFTELGDRDYPQLRRPDDGERSSRSPDADNRHVVAYNSYLLSKYECHLNVEVISSIKYCKYIYKYLYKGFDRALVEAIENVDLNEMTTAGPGAMTMFGHILIPRRLLAKMPRVALQRRNAEAVDLLARNNVQTRDDNGNPVLVYNECHFITDMGSTTSMEAAYHLAGYPRAGASHEVVTNFVHGEDSEPMKIEWNKEQEAYDRAQAGHVYSQLTAWFELNKLDTDEGEFARKLTFDDIPRYFSYDYKTGKYKLRKKRRDHFMIGQLKFVSPRYKELFAVRLLCLHRKGVTSFEELKQIDGEDYDTFTDAAQAMGLMNNEEEWDDALKEAGSWQMPWALRRMFISILLYCAPNDARGLFDKNKELFYQRKDWSVEKNLAHTLYHISSGLRAHGRSLSYFGLPEIDKRNLPHDRELENDYMDDDEVDLERCEKLEEDMYQSLTDEQRNVVDRIVKSIEENQKESFFLEAPAGSGKTQTQTHTLYYILRSKGIKVMYLAHPGIAAALLPQGQTVHRAFDLPLEVSDTMNSRIHLETNRTAELRKVQVFLWDKACMSDRRIVTAVSNFLEHLHADEQLEKPFGGAVMVFGCDWRQTLPIVKDVKRDAVVNYTLKHSIFWKDLVKVHLTENIRARDDPEFAALVKEIGDGQAYFDDIMNGKLPKQMFMNNETDLIKYFYDSQKLEDKEYIRNTCILTLDNMTALEINERVLRMKLGEVHIYYSRDEHIPDRCFTDLDPEIYNQINNICGLPPHELNLKVGAAVILLRNINVNLGLVNGLRMRVVRLGQNVIECELLNREGRLPEKILLHRMALTPSEISSAETCFIRWQFPIRLSYGMTIDKCQGQTMGQVGILLRTPVFAHGQLYVALSRVRRFGYIRIVNRASPNPRLVRNIVYQNAFSD